MSEEQISLPFSDDKQSALLGHLILNSKFFRNAYQRIQPNWFLSDKRSRIYKILIKYWEVYGIHPTPHEFRSFKEFLILDVKDRELLYSFITAALASTTTYRLQVLTVDLTNWLHSVMLLSALKDSEKLFNSQNVKECHSRLMTAVKDVSNSRFNDEEEIGFGGFQEYLKRSESERREAITTGLSLLDSCLLDGAINGGLLRGDTTIVEAPLNTGKSTALITMAIHNVRRGKAVLFMTHQDRPDDIRLKMLACYLNIKLNDLFELYKTEEGCARIEQATKQLQKYLKYIPYNKAGKMVVEEVVPIIRNAHEDRVANNNGQGFDLLVSDYPACLTSILAYKGNLQKRSIDQIVYSEYVQLALEYKFHALLAIQTNREGSKINKGLNREKRILTVEDVQESFGPMQDVSNVLTLNRSPEYERDELMVIGVAKCRSNVKNSAIMAKTNFKHSTTFSNELGAFGWIGQKMPEKNIEELFRTFNGQIIPEHKAAVFNL